MARYELIIEQQQPTCGGRAPTRSEVRMIETSDPAEYVRSQEPGLEQSVSVNDEGATVIQVMKNNMWVRYEFNED